MNKLRISGGSWQSVHFTRVIIVFAIALMGSLPPPKPAPAATGAAASFAGLSRDGDIWPLTPDEPPELTAGAPEKARPAVNAASIVEATETPAATPAAESTPAPESNPSAKIISGWLPFWDMTEGMRVVDEFPDALTEVSPFWYEVAADGNVINSPGAESNDILKKLRSRGKTIIPTIMSADGPAVSSVINDEAKRSLHLKEIMKKIKNPLYDGIDIDYENLPAADRDAFSRFVRELAVRVHKKHKKLVITVNSKTSDPGNWNGAQSHDYAAIGASADFVRVMAYDQHYAAGPPGPVAAIDWVEEVIAFSLTKVPKEKLILGVPLYGYDWGGEGRAKSVVHDEAAAKSIASQAPVEWDEQSASSFFRYSDDSGAHTVWFENSRSLEAKIALAKKYDLGGIAIWRLGREDKTFYQKVKSQLAK